MPKFKTSVNLFDAVGQLKTFAKASGISLGKEFYVVVDAFDFGRDVNGNTINKYRASLHCADLVTVQNGYSNVGSVEVLTSPYRREQSLNGGTDMALHWLKIKGYDLSYESTTYIGGEIDYVTKDNRRYRHVYRVTNSWMRAGNK